MNIHTRILQTLDALLKEKEENAALPIGDEERLSHGQLVALNDAIDALDELTCGDTRLDCRFGEEEEEEKEPYDEHGRLRSGVVECRCGTSVMVDDWSRPVLCEECTD